MPVFGMNNGIIPIIGYNYGAQNRIRIMKTYKFGTLFSCSLMLIGACIFQFLPAVLLECFSASAEMLSIGVPALRTISLCFVFAGASIVMGSMFQAFGRGISSMIVSVIRQLVILLPAAFLLSLTGEVTAVWWAFPISETVSLFVSVFIFIALYKKVISHIPDGAE